MAAKGAQFITTDAVASANALRSSLNTMTAQAIFGNATSNPPTTPISTPSPCRSHSSQGPDKEGQPLCENTLTHPGLSPYPVFAWEAPAKAVISASLASFLLLGQR